MEINGINFDMDIDELAEQHSLFKENLARYARRSSDPSFLMPTLEKPSQAYIELRQQYEKDGLSQAAINDILDEDIENSIHSEARFLNRLLGSANTTTSELEKESNLERRALDRALSEVKPLPYTSLMALCLIFMMDEDDMNITFGEMGHQKKLHKSDKLEIRVFKGYIKSQIYSLPRYAKTVCNSADILNKNSSDYEELTHFFWRPYKEFNLPLRWKASELK